jgi:3-carboxy-cis,cis-muconate cycloisomerase
MLSSAAMRGVCDDAAYLQHMLDFEAALTRAEATAGVVPKTAAAPTGGCPRSTRNRRLKGELRCR